MENKISEFKKLVEKKSKINKENTNSAISLLFDIYKSDNDSKLVSELLIFASHVVAGSFFCKYASSLDSEETENICIELEKLIGSAKLTRTMLPTGFSIVAYGLENEAVQKKYMKLLSSLVKATENKDGFTETKCKALRDHLLDKTDGEVFEADFSEWDEQDILRFRRYLTSAQLLDANVSYKPKLEQWLSKHDFSQQDNTLLTEPEPVDDKHLENYNQPYAKDNEISCKMSETMLKELRELYNNAFVKNNAFKQLEDSINEKNLAISKLNNILALKEQEINKLTASISEKNGIEDQYKSEVFDLNERLKTAFSFDNTSAKQAVLTLKKDIASALKLSYSDFCDASDAPFDQDNYNFYKTTLAHVFKTLLRYGIEF